VQEDEKVLISRKKERVELMNVVEVVQWAVKMKMKMRKRKRKRRMIC